MKLRKVILLSLAIFSSFSSVYSQNVENYLIKKINSNILIDGKMDENVWTLAKPTNNFVVLGTNQTASTTAFAKMLWDDNYLYVGFYSQDSKVWATFTDRDDPLYQEDVVEVYIDQDGDGKNYLEIEVNPLNTIFDLWLTKPWAEGGAGNVAWTMAGLVTAVSIDGTIADNSDQDKAWVCEMALPFSAMEFAAPSRNYPPLINDRWRMNLYRFDRSSTDNNSGELLGWSKTDGSAHEPDKFSVVTFGGLMTDIQTEPAAQLAENFVLRQNYPNPFNPTTCIEFSMPKAGHAVVAIFNARGSRIATLCDAYRKAGRHTIEWTPTGLASGVYFYQLTIDDFTTVRKLVFQK